jgi:type III secretory pathway component EscS
MKVDSEVLSIFIRLVLVLILPLTAITFFASLLGSILLSWMKVPDSVAIYSVRLVAVVISFLFMAAAFSNFFVDEVKRMLVLY